MISTRSHYAIKAMRYMAINVNKIVSISEISKHEEIPTKYLEQVISILNKNSLIKSFRGNNGGYMLKKKADDYSIYEIIEAVDGNLEINYDSNDLFIWKNYNQLTKNYFSNIKLSNLVEEYNKNNDIYNYCI